MRGQQRCGCRWLACWRIIPARAGPTNGVGDVMWWFTDHPRSCGANTIYWENSVGVLGSSPLVRGQHDLLGKLRGCPRIIPARAGPTRSTGKTPWVSSDHPRSCGANLTEEPFVISPSGSSPLVRGQRTEVSVRSHLLRIIPARAGPTTRLLEGLRSSPDHPRSCGANLSDSELESIRGGSSPLVRGQRRHR